MVNLQATFGALVRLNRFFLVTLDYQYYEGKSHQPERIGDIWYRYDQNGNMTEARQGGHAPQGDTAGTVVADGDVRWTSQGFGLDRTGSGGGASKVWARFYTWDEENRMVRSVEGTLTVEYRYGADGQRAVKYSKRGESLYFDAVVRDSAHYNTIPLGKRPEGTYAACATAHTTIPFHSENDPKGRTRTIA